MEIDNVPIHEFFGYSIEVLNLSVPSRRRLYLESIKEKALEGNTTRDIFTINVDALLRHSLI